MKRNLRRYKQIFLDLNATICFNYIEYKTTITVYKMKHHTLPKHSLSCFHLLGECCYVTSVAYRPILTTERLLENTVAL